MAASAALDKEDLLPANLGPTAYAQSERPQYLLSFLEVLHQGPFCQQSQGLPTA
jgi:hypothetical protein